MIVLGQLLDSGDIARWLGEVPEGWAYVMCLCFVWFDAVIPIFPGETTLSAASTIAAGGGLRLEMVMFAGAIGAILGDSSLFWIARANRSQDATPPRQGAGESEGSHRLGQASTALPAS